MSFADHMARADRIVAGHLSDGEAIYRCADGTTLLGVPYMLDHNVEVFDDDSGIGRITRAITVPVEHVPDSAFGDVIETPDRKWQYNRVLKDDGSFRQIEVV